MPKSKQFLLQLVFIFSVALIPSLFIIRLFQPGTAVARSELQPEEKAEPAFLNPLVSVVEEDIAATETARVKTSPTLISIPGADVTLPVAVGEIVNNQWTLYDDRVAWLSTSEEPGKGNVILYAHNQKHLFQPLHVLAIGDEIVIEHDGWEYSYIVSETKKVEPDEVEAVLSTDQQLTLYTCDGVFDQRRLVVIARPAETI